MTSYGTLPTDDGPSNLEQQTSTPTRTRAEWRRGLGEALENEKVHWTILGLTVLDALCVLFQIIYTFFHECQTDHAPTHWMRGLVELAEIISMCITCLFLLEMLLAFIAFGPRYYLPGWEHWKMHILDVVVVVATFVFDIVLHGKEREVAELLIILRLWRVVRIVEAAVMGVTYANEETNQALNEELQEVKKAYAALEKELADERRLRADLEEKLNKRQSE